MHAPNLRRQNTQRKSDAELAEAVSDGGPLRRASHTFTSRGLKSGQVTAVVSHLRTFGK